MPAGCRRGRLLRASAWDRAPRATISRGCSLPGWGQGLSDWIGAHGRAFGYFGGIPAQVVSDNLKSGVTRACFYEPAVNRTYADMAEHYGTAIVPARPRKPRDKAKVEVAVQIAQRWIVARLRNQRFFSLTDLNAAIRILVDRLALKRWRQPASGRS